MKIRYAKQHTKFDCAPVAIVNAMKWSGEKISYKENKEYLKSLFKLDQNKGVYPNFFIKFLKKNKNSLPFKLQLIIKGITISLIKDLVKNDQIIMLGIDKRKTAHIGLVTEINNKKLTLINFGKNIPTVYIESIKEFRKNLNNKSIGYVIKKYD